MTSLSEQLKPEVLSRLGGFSIMAKDAVIGLMSGVHASISKGSGGDFIQYRPWTQGENLRDVDWKLYARQERLYNKVRRDDTVMRCAIVVDCTASMSYKGKSAVLSKYQYAAILGTCLASVAASQNDNVSLFIYNGSGMEQMPLAREDDVYALVDGLGKLEPSGTARLDAILGGIDVFLGHTRGLTFFISDLIDLDLVTLLRHFQANGRELRLCHILDKDELELPFSGTLDFRDSETNEGILVAPDLTRQAYGERMGAWLGKVRDLALEWHAHYRFSTSDVSFLEYFC
ncbi:MAG: DUF58 domain-containing protein [Victivallales bacterium]|nr:DUF58 domain-containing protein [Victivallales bacterium]